jgi:hypothetical protein
LFGDAIPRDSIDRRAFQHGGADVRVTGGNAARVDAAATRDIEQ